MAHLFDYSAGVLTGTLGEQKSLVEQKGKSPEVTCIGGHDCDYTLDESKRKRQSSGRRRKIISSRGCDRASKRLLQCDCGGL